MDNKKKNAVSFATVVTITGAVISYRVGAGFASGNECIQIFGSWGQDIGWAIFGATLTLLIGAVGTYLLAYQLQFKGSEDAYKAVGGKKFGRFVQIFTGLSITLNLFTMFAGAGSLLNQHMGLPNWVGSLLVGVIAIISLLGGLKSLEKVLGSVGIFILIYMVVFCVIKLFKVTPNMDNIYGAQEAVKAGEIMQVNLFALPPFSWIPGLAEHNNAFINGVVYGSEATFSGFPFLIMLAKKCKTKKEAVVCGLAGDLGYMFCVCISLVVLMFNFECIYNPVTKIMNAFPTLAAVTKLLPSIAWTYAILCFAGVFTTVSGYLFAVDEMVFKENVTSTKSRIFQVVLAVIGIALGGVLPFSKLINILMPIRGVVGVLLIVLILAALAHLKHKPVADGDEQGKEIEEMATV